MYYRLIENKRNEWFASGDCPAGEDGLKVSDYLKETAVRHIEGDITIDDVREQLKSYYVSKTTHDNDYLETEEERHRTGQVIPHQVLPQSDVRRKE